jgi:hypothetical protein
MLLCCYVDFAHRLVSLNNLTKNNLTKHFTFWEVGHFFFL